MEAILGLPGFTQTRTEAAAPDPPQPMEGMSSRMPGLVPDHTIIPGEGSHVELGGSLPPRRPEKKQGLFQQLRGSGEVGTGGDPKGLASPGRTWIRVARIPRIPSAPSPPPRGRLWPGELVGIVYLTELLTLPSSPSSPEGWLDLSVPGRMLVKGLSGLQS